MFSSIHSKLTGVLIAVLIFSGFKLASAQDSLVLSITPPLFRLNIEPGDKWSSSIRIINNNPYDITVYPTVVNFESDGESGYGKFTPVAESSEINPDLLANWIKLEHEAVFIPREQSMPVPFSVEIPEGASPGGHYAAILVGTKPPSRSTSGAQVGVSSFVSSLLLVRVGGEVIEKGIIREFSTDMSFYDKPEINLNLRFENSGNAHIIPRGDITIYNMWGKERGKIFINKDSDFGNVLPNSVRKFSFTWKGEDDSYEIGRFRAVANLTFGGEDKQSISKAVSFWIVPVVPTIKFASIVLGFILFMAWSIKAYVRRALSGYERKEIQKEEVSVDFQAFEAIAQPLREGIVDLRKASGFIEEERIGKRNIAGLLIEYKKATAFLLIAAIFIAWGSAYLIDVRSSAKNYTVSSGEASADKKMASIKIISSHDSNEDLRIKKMLEKNGINVDYSEKSYENMNNSKIIIRYLPEYVREASLINKILGEDSFLEEVSEQENDLIIITSKVVNSN